MRASLWMNGRLRGGENCWRVAAGIVAGFFAINAVGPTSWWLMPVVVALMLGFTLIEATRPAKVAA